MAYKITASVRGLYIEMPYDTDLRFYEACHLAELYKEKNPIGILSVIDQETGDCVYQV